MPNIRIFKDPGKIIPEFVKEITERENYDETKRLIKLMVSTINDIRFGKEQRDIWKKIYEFREIRPLGRANTYRIFCYPCSDNKYVFVGYSKQHNKIKQKKYRKSLIDRGKRFCEVKR